MQDAGKVAITPKGEYNNATAYEYLDSVTYPGESKVYVALQNTKGVAPPSDSSIWAEWFDIADTTSKPLAEAVASATKSAIDSAQSASMSASSAAESANQAAEVLEASGIIVGKYKIGVTAEGVPFFEEVEIDPIVYIAEELETALATADKKATAATTSATNAKTSETNAAQSATQSATYAQQSKEYRGDYSFGVENEIPYLQEEQ